MRVGVFGGTFDPPHVGHLLAATDAADQLSLDRVLFVPAATQPLKAAADMTAGAHRLAMVERMIQGDPRLAVETMEVERGGLSYTVETLRRLRERWPAGTADLYLLLGADAAAQFSHWREPDAVRSLAEVVVLARGEDGVSVPGLRGIQTRRVDVSSSEIRERVRAGKSVRGMLTDGVAEYVATHALYR